MFTECPACNTVFRVHASQLEAAGGKVRCGECLAVFDAREYRRDDLEEPAPETPQEERREEAPATQGALGFDGPDLFGQELAAAMEQAEPEPPAARPEPETPQPEPEPPQARPAPRPRTPAKKPVPQPSLELPFGHEFEPPRRASALWPVTGGLLLLLLAGQYLWFNRQPLSQEPGLQPVVGAFCTLLPCGLEAAADPAAFELTGRAVQSHPSLQGALLVDVTFVNRRNTSRPYPELELIFTDMEGNPLASRRFTPKEYLGQAPQQPLAAGAEAHAVLELLDPGDLAAGYEFRFF